MASIQGIAYYRVSTDRQGQSGLGLEAQKASVTAYARAQGIEIVSEHIEIESGKRPDRPELAAAIGKARKAGAQLIIARLDRLARNVAFIANLMETGIDFVACDMPNADRFMLHVYAAMAEEEGRRISSRTKAALAAAKARGVTLGGRRGDSHLKAAKANQANAKARNRPTMAVIDQIEKNGVTSFRGIAKALMNMGVKTPTGKAIWYAASVQRVKATMAMT